MNPRTKLHLWSAAYCALLASLNWFRTVEYSRRVGMTYQSYVPVGVAWLLSFLTVLYLAWLCIRQAQLKLELGVKVAPGKWIQSPLVILYALPLLWHQQATTSWREMDGTLATMTNGYGQPLSSWVFCYAVVGLLLFQVLVRLSTEGEERAGESRSAIAG